MSIATATLLTIEIAPYAEVADCLARSMQANAREHHPNQISFCLYLFDFDAMHLCQSMHVCTMAHSTIAGC